MFCMYLLVRIVVSPVGLVRYLNFLQAALIIQLECTLHKNTLPETNMA